MREVMSAAAVARALAIISINVTALMLQQHMAEPVLLVLDGLTHMKNQLVDPHSTIRSTASYQQKTF